MKEHCGCACNITPIREAGEIWEYEVKIIYCHLHQAAPDLYEALKTLCDSLFNEFGIASSQFDGWIKAGEALTKANPDSK